MDHQHLLEEKSPRQNNNNNSIMVSSSSSTFCYPNVTQSNYDPNPEMFHLANGLEMIGFQPKPLNNNDPNDQLSKGAEFFHDDHENRGVGRGTLDDHHHHNQVGAFMNEYSLRSCVFPCEGNERPSQGLSLSLSSSNPSSIGVQSFELRTNHHNQILNHLPNHQRFNSRDGFLGKSQSFLQQQQQQQQEFFLGKSGGNGSNSSGNSNTSSMSVLQFEIVRNSKYMGPVQELLNEFCSLGTQQKQSLMMMKNKKKKHKDDNLDLLHDDRDDDQINDVNHASSSSSRNIYSSLCGLSMLDLQKRKTKLFGMLEELDRRYKHYCDQLKAIESSFESVAGHGTANGYTTLASKAMSRHFRCLRDSLVAQIKATKKAMGEKDGASSVVPGTTKGETPRLRILDQTLRQQRAFQQMTLMESHPWRPQRGLPERSVSVLRAWLFEHFLHPYVLFLFYLFCVPILVFLIKGATMEIFNDCLCPWYPSDVDKHILARQTNLSRSQVSNWFINARVRLWKPMVEQMYIEETKEQEDNNMLGSSSDATDHHLPSDHDGLIQDQKPDPNELIRLDPESLTSILNTTQNDNNSPPHNAPAAINLQQNQPFGRDEAFAYVALPDFPSSSSYTHNHASTGYGSTQNNDNNAPHQGFGGGGTSGGNNVSLTLGLQQHGGNGVSLAFSPVSQGSLFYGRDHIDDCQQVHGYSLLEGDQGQNLPYRNLMDAQLLHDFTQ